MAQIELENITHYYGDSSDAFAVSELSLVWEDGSANALLGPSGCGKTTLLNIISGLITPKSGRILFDGKDVTQLSPRNRHIAQVFQFPVVYDTMSVERNLAFPMKNAGAGKAEIRKRVGEVAELLGLSEHMKKSAVQLSDAQKQMLSLGRGIVRTDTSALLLDEPLTVIDQKIRWQLRKTLRQVQSELGITMIYVTHDQHEALTFAHNVSVMSDGVMLQTASPEKLYSEPAHPFVGHFIGSPGMNFIVVKRNGDWLETDTSEIRFPYDECGIEVEQDQEVALGIRPEYISISSEAIAGWPQMTARIIEDQGSTQVLTLEEDGLRLKVRAKYSDDIVEGDRFWISFDKEQVNRFDVSEISSNWLPEGLTDMKARPWIFLAPALIIMSISAFVPLLTVINYSLHHIFAGSESKFVGFQNYAEVLNDPEFRDALKLQMQFSCLVLLTEIPFGLLLALAVPREGWKASLCLVLLGIPLLIPYVVVAIVWKLITQAEIGPLSVMLNKMGYEYSVALDRGDAFSTILLADVWHWTPLVVLLMYAGLQSIPPAYYRAAEIDGASRLQVFRYITLPKLRPVLILAVLLRFMDSLKIYSEPLLLTGGGPGNATTFLSLFVARKGESYELGYAGASSIIYLYLVILLSYVFYQYSTRTPGEEHS